MIGNYSLCTRVNGNIIFDIKRLLVVQIEVKYASPQLSIPLFFRCGSSTNAKFKQGLVVTNLSWNRRISCMVACCLRSPMMQRWSIEEQGAVGLHERVPLHAKYVLSILCCLLPAISSSRKEVALVVTPPKFLADSFFSVVLGNRSF